MNQATDMTDALQRAAYESAACLGPTWSAVSAGFAVILFGTAYITPAGERYLATLQGEIPYDDAFDDHALPSRALPRASRASPSPCDVARGQLYSANCGEGTPRAAA